MIPTNKKLDELSNTIFKKLLNETKSDKLEHGVLLCEDKWKITLTKTLTGTKNSIELSKLSCKDKKVIGSFHTHLNGDSFLSIDDLISENEKGMEFSCVGAYHKDQPHVKTKINCFKKPFGISEKTAKNSFEEAKSFSNLLKKYNISDEVAEKAFKENEYINHPDPKARQELRVGQNMFLRKRDALTNEAMIEERHSLQSPPKGFYEKVLEEEYTYKPKETTTSKILKKFNL